VGDQRGGERGKKKKGENFLSSRGMRGENAPSPYLWEGKGEKVRSVPPSAESGPQRKEKGA